MPPKPKLHKDKGKLKSIPKPVQKQQNSSNTEASTSSSSTSISNEDQQNQAQFEVELVWCIQQLQTALGSGKLNDKQVVEQTKTLNSLMSNSTPAIRKRQLMRLTFGDYRAKMAKEEAKYLKVNNRIVLQQGTPSKKSVFVKKAPFLTSGKDFKFNFQITDELSKLNIEPVVVEAPINTQNTEGLENSKQDEMKDFHFMPSSNTFRFNFTSN